MGASFEPSASYVPAGLRKAAKEALNMGWTARKSGREGWFLRSPKGKQKFYLPVSCKDADALARELRSRINKAYLAESGGVGPKYGDVPGAVDQLTRMQDKVMEQTGASIRQGPDPTLACPDCDGEWLEVDGFMAHQEACQANVRARLAAAHASQGVTEQAESAHSGTISTKEEAPLATQSSTPTPKPGPKPGPAPQRNPETGRKQGYQWTQVNGRGNPLHEIIYEAVRMTRRFKDETDSKYSKRLADYIEGEGLLAKLPDADPDVQAAYVLGQIRDLLGGGEPQGLSEEEVEQFKKDIAERDEQIAGLTKKVDEYKDFFSAMSEMAPKEPK